MELMPEGYISAVLEFRSLPVLSLPQGNNRATSCGKAPYYIVRLCTLYHYFRYFESLNTKR